MIQAKKAARFFLPNPMNKETSREKDSEFSKKLQEMNTLDLIDFDQDYGTIYFVYQKPYQPLLGCLQSSFNGSITNGEHISTLDTSPYDLKTNQDVASSMKTYSIGHDKSFIKGLKLIKEKALILISVNDKILIHSIQADGSIGKCQFTLSLSQNDNIGKLEYIIDGSNSLYAVVVDSDFALHIIDYNIKSVTVKENVVDANFVEGLLYYIDKEGSSLHIIDPSQPENELNSFETALEDLCAVEYLNKQHSLLIFFGESPSANENIFEFGAGVTRDDFIRFNYQKITLFEEMFDSFDNIIELLKNIIFKY